MPVTRPAVFFFVLTRVIVAWARLDSQNPTGFVGSFSLDPIIANVVEVSGDSTSADNLEVLFNGNEGFYSAYMGLRGPGVYLNDAAANTNTVNGVDGTIGNPVSTIAAAKSLADSMSLDRIYLVNDSEITLAATMADYEFVGIGEITANVVNLGSQDPSNSAFYNVAIEGTQGGAGRILAVDCALQDPGAGDTTLHIFACRCGIVDRIQVDTSNDNVFDGCFSLVAGTSAPVIQATGASGTISVRHYSGGIEFESLSASHNVSVETDGQVIFNASCNVNATVAMRGCMTITDNTAGMNNLTVGAVYNTEAVNTEVDTGISDAALATAANLATVDTNVDAILLDTGTDGVVVAAGSKTGYSLANDARPTKNVALSNFCFLMVDATDFATPETGLTITSQISKDGAAFGATSNSATEIGSGWYKINLTQTEMNADTVLLRFTSAGAAARNVQILTQPSL